MLKIFNKAQLAELASYAQIAAQRVRVIKELEQIIDVSMDENQFQSLIASAPWLIEPSWTVITKNQSLKNFKFEAGTTPPVLEVPLTQAVIYGWYDNELGSYTNMLGELTVSIAERMV